MFQKKLPGASPHRNATVDKVYAEQTTSNRQKGIKIRAQSSVELPERSASKLWFALTSTLKATPTEYLVSLRQLIEESDGDKTSKAVIPKAEKPNINVPQNTT
jgi:hypothetical protein